MVGTLACVGMKRPSFEAILADIKARDHQDMTREDSPLVRLPDAVYVDTTEMTPDAVMTRLLEVVKARIGSGPGSR